MHEKLILELFKIGSIKFGEFKLKSGIISPIYIDLRLIVSYPKILKMVAEAMWEKIKNLNFDLICGVPYTALPIATALSLKHNIPMVMRRKEKKDYGTKQLIEGIFSKNQNCLIIEDLITSGASIFETIEPLEESGLKIKNIVVLINREQGGKKYIEKKGYKLQAVFTISEMLKILENKKLLPTEMVMKVKTFLKNNQI